MLKLFMIKYQKLLKATSYRRIGNNSRLQDANESNSNYIKNDQ